jgi:tRNA 2-selenouridine synthase
VEGESQRIGKVFLPGTVYRTMTESCKVWCHASLETRVQRLTVEYAHVEYREAMVTALERIKKKLGGVRYAEIRSLLDNWDVEGIARGLVEHYYDRLYYKNRAWMPDAEIDLEDFGRAGQQLAEFWSERQGRR